MMWLACLAKKLEIRLFPSDLAISNTLRDTPPLFCGHTLPYSRLQAALLQERE